MNDPTHEVLVTLHLDDHHLVIATPNGDAIGGWTSVEAALEVGRAVVEAVPTTRLIVSTWPSAALPALAEHARRQGWFLALDWSPDEVLDGNGRVRSGADAVEAYQAQPWASDRPVDEGLAPTRRHHVWFAGDGAAVEEVGLEGQPLP